MYGALGASQSTDVEGWLPLVGTAALGGGSGYALAKNWDGAIAGAFAGPALFLLGASLGCKPTANNWNCMGAQFERVIALTLAIPAIAFGLGAAWKRSK